MSQRESAPRKHTLEPLVYAVICMTVILFVAGMERMEMFQKMEHSMQDLRFRIRGPEPHCEDIVIVAIDPQTLDQLGLVGMPPRHYHAKLIENLFIAGAKAVLLDILFLTYTGEPEKETLSVRASEQDSLLSDALSRYPDAIIARKQLTSIERATSTSAGEPPLPMELFHYPGQLTFVDMYHDSDSFVRRAKLISDDLPEETDWNYSFALKAAMYALNADTAHVDKHARKAYVGDRIIPLDENDTMIINYCMDEQTYDESGGYYSYEQVIDDESEFGLQALIEMEAFRDKVVLVGATYPDSKDTQMTPFYLGSTLYSKSEYPMYGVHVHKNIASTIVNRRFIPPVGYTRAILLIAVMSFVSVLINYRFKGFSGLFLSITLIAAYAFMAAILFIEKRFLIPIAAPGFAAVSLSYASATTYNFLSERRQKAMIRGAFSHYVPGKVVNELLRNPDMLRLGGEERVMTVIFSDVAGFTAISEKLSPTELVAFLNEYLTAMTDIILSYDGIIDKYEGDAIMAEFGAPLPDPDHARKACLAALEMQKTLAGMRDKWKAEGKPELRARVGVNSGPMVIGNMGSREIFDYTVMGDNVNLSSRLEGANKIYGTYIMCSEATRKLAGEGLITRELDLIRVKGKTEGVRIHEVFAQSGDDLSESDRRLLDIYSQGLEAYKDRRWETAAGYFREALAVDRRDGPSALHLERCEEFMRNSPGENWDGIFTMRTK